MKKSRLGFISLHSGVWYARVDALMIEGHYQCISHAPFSKQPRFASKEKAIEFVQSFGVQTQDIVQN